MGAVSVFIEENVRDCVRLGGGVHDDRGDPLGGCGARRSLSFGRLFSGLQNSGQETFLLLASISK